MGTRRRAWVPPSADVSLVERAAWWLDMGASGSPFATLTALIAFGWVLTRRVPGGAPEALLLRKVGLVLAGVMAVVQALGLVAVVVGEVLLLDSTGGRDPWTTLNRFRVSSLVSSLVLAVLFALLAWVLRPRQLADAVPPAAEPDTAPEPPNGGLAAANDPTKNSEVRWKDNPAGLYQRPPWRRDD